MTIITKLARRRTRPRTTFKAKAKDLDPKAKAKDLDFGLKDQGQGQGLTSPEIADIESIRIRARLAYTMHECLIFGLYKIN